MVLVGLLLLSGVIGGFLAGLIGIGGGIVYVFAIPILLPFFGIPLEESPQYTIANSIFAIVFASSAANYTLAKKGLFFIRPVVSIGLSSIATSILTLKYIVNTPWFGLKEFNLAVIALMGFMLFYTLKNVKKNYDTPIESLGLPTFIVIGMCSGVIASLSGLGGGIIIIPLLNQLLKVNVKKASYISSGAIMITALLMTLFNLTETPKFVYEGFSLGYIIFPIGLLLSLGVVVASPIGVNTAAKLSSKTISYIYAAILSLVIIKKLIELLEYYPK